MLIVRLIWIFLCLSGFIPQAGADTVYLKNGRSLTGLLAKETADEIELDIGFGNVKFHKNEIMSIYKSTPDEKALIGQKWEREKSEAQLRIQRAQEARKLEPKGVKVSRESGQLTVDVVLNRATKATLFLDTGASVIVLNKEIGKKLGIDISGDKDIVQMGLADGRKVNAKMVLLNSVSVQGLEAKDVQAVVLLDGAEDPRIKDGLLGMSFLSRFNFKVDYQNEMLTLEK